MQSEEKQFDSYFSGKMTQQEKYLFLKKVDEDRKLKKEFARIQNAKGISCLYDFRGDEQIAATGWMEFNKIITNRRFKRISLNILKYAAIVAVVVLSTFFLKRYYFSSGEIRYNIVEVPVGESMLLSLSDGTTVNLSPRSIFKYPDSFKGEERRVILNGEAFFDVKKDAGKPFIVQANRYNIKVLGTKFNVFDYMSYAMYEATLYEGAMEIYKDNKQMKPIVLAPYEQVFLKDNNLVKNKIDPSYINIRENGIIAFESRSFSEIIKKLELYYNINFVITNINALDKIYTGKFRIQDSIEDVLDALQKTNKFSYTISSDKKIVYIM